MHQVSPREAYELMSREGYAYLDVRTPMEFAAAHPVGADNVPVALPGEHGFVPNQAFVREVSARHAPDTPLIVGCATGVRSREAARLLRECGFTRIVEQRAGMDGVRDAFGRVAEPGWRAEGLPTAALGEG